MSCRDQVFITMRIVLGDIFKSLYFCAILALFWKNNCYSVSGSTFAQKASHHLLQHPVGYRISDPCFVGSVRCAKRDQRTRNVFKQETHKRLIVGSPQDLDKAICSTRRNLFFKKREEESLKVKRREAHAKIPDYVLDELRDEHLYMPYEFHLCSEKSGENKLDNNELHSIVKLRLLHSGDLETIVPLCVAEFGGGGTTLNDLLENFPWDKKPTAVTQYLYDWWENFALPVFIYWTFRLKIVARDPQDHALIVATLQKGHSQNASLLSKSHNLAKVIGMVEVSRQPPDGKRNPPAFPLPFWYKTLYCRLKKLPPPDGWVTNLLVSPMFRGQGYSKVLMAAAEGIARTWGCSAIHLHCDADMISGKIPQALYKNLGYQMVEDADPPFSWMGTELSSKIFMIAGVPLLYFRKALFDEV